MFFKSASLCGLLLFGAGVLSRSASAQTATAIQLPSPLSTLPAPLPAMPFLHPLFSDGMVLQRGLAAPVWGWAAPGTRVEVALKNQAGVALANASAVAGADGKWLAKIGPLVAGGPDTLAVVGGAKSVTLQNVMTGDVWLCSGQSNMQFGIGNVNDAPAEIASANYPSIRLLSVPQKIATAPQSTLDTRWEVCTPQSVARGGWNGFSAVAYFFGRELNNRLQVPIGLIHSSYGGTVAEAWTSGAALSKLPDFAPAVTRLQASAREQNQPGYRYETAMTDWWAKNDVGSVMSADHQPVWSDPAFDDAAWQTLSLPANLSAVAPGFRGATWFRREFDLPAAWTGKTLEAHLGALDERDTAWINGVKIGENNDNWTQRQYSIAANLLHPGRNVLAVRVYNPNGDGGFSGPADAMKLQIAGDAMTAPISLAGAWKLKISTPKSRLSTEPQRLSDPNNVSVLYNGMIAPLAPFGIKGVIWYQGESNAGRGVQYRALLPALIRDWRAEFGQGDFPFYIVQLANWQAPDAQPRESGLAEVREAQMLTTQTVPNTALATAIDVGDAADIHPKNKQAVGHRLALDALALTYGQKIEYSGPIFQRQQIEGSRIRIFFDHAAGLAFQDATQTGFAIAGADKKWVWADSKIEGSTVVVSAPQIKEPVAVRYAWADNPRATLQNAAHLPALPFRTDSP